MIKAKLLLIIFVSITSICKGQTLFLGQKECLAKNNIDTRLQQLFDTTKILLVSFEGTMTTNIELELAANQKKVLNTNPLKELIQLDTTQISGLFKLFEHYRGDIHSSQVKSRCYDPRNGILFLNQKNEVLAYIEVCFQCNESYIFPKRVGDLLTPRCDAIFKALNIFMSEQGISHGTWSKEFIEIMKSRN